MSHMNAQCQICNTPSKQSEGTITHEYAMSHMQHAQQAKWITNYTSRSIWSTQGHNCSSLPGIEQQFCWQKIGECLYSSLGPMKFAADSVLYCLYYSTWLRDSFSQNQCGLITIFCISQIVGLEKLECCSVAFFLFDLWLLLGRHDHLKAVSLPKMCRAVECCLSWTFFNIKLSRKSFEGSKFAKSRWLKFAATRLVFSIGLFWSAASQPSCIPQSSPSLPSLQHVCWHTIRIHSSQNLCVLLMCTL